jgi:hypothetical protein
MASDLLEHRQTTLTFGKESLRRRFRGAHVLTRVVLPFTLATAALVAAWTVLNEEEFFVAFFLLFWFLVSALVWLYGWRAFPQRPDISTLLKVGMFLAIAIISLYSGLVIWQKKGDKPWTNLASLMKTGLTHPVSVQPQITSSPISTPPPNVSPAGPDTTPKSQARHMRIRKRNKPPCSWEGTLLGKC